MAICGLDCGKCAAFIATKNNDNALREKIAKEWTARHAAENQSSIKPEEINCRGCFSQGPLYQNCAKCNVRKCALDKGFKNCQECANYKCDKLTEVQKRFFK